MSVQATKRHLLLCAACFLSVVLAGCGGAQARKARHLAKGQEYFSAGNYEKARVEFRNALQIAPNDAQARYENGLVDEKLGNPREAAQFYQGVIDVDPNNAAARAGLGKLYLFSGAADKAMETVKPGLDAHPKDPGLLAIRAAARVQLKDSDGALTDAQEAVSLAPTDEAAVAVLAGVYKSRNEIDKARALLEDAVKKIPDTVELRLALAQVYATLNLEPQVEGVLLDLVRLKPNDKAQRLRLAQFYSRLNHNDEAERVLRDGVKALPAERDLKIALIDFLAVRRGRDAADKELKAMVAANPQDYDIRLAQGQFFEQGKEPTRAEAVYRRIIDDAGTAPAANMARDRLAALEIQNNDVASAQQLLSEVLAKNPRDNDALILRGNLELAAKDPKSAIADLRAVLRDQPNAIGVMRSLARAHLANGEPALAEETMRRAVDASSNDVNTRLDLAQLLAQLGKPEQAKPVIDELVKQHPDDFTALDTQFRIAAVTNDLATAKSAADAIVALKPKLALGYFYQGSVAEAQKRPDDALKLYGTAMDMQTDATEPLQAMALLLVKLNRFPEALKRLDEVAARVPNMPTPLNIKGDILLGNQHPTEAAEAFRNSIQRDPKWWVPYRGLARAQSASNDTAAAASTLRDGISKVNDAEFLQIDLARIYETQGKADMAIQLYDDTLRKNPRSDVAANNLAMLLITYKRDQSSLDRAKALSQRFSESTNPNFLDTYGWVLYKRGESAAAVTVLQSVLSKAPDSPISQYHLGMAQASVGEDEAARTNLSLSLKSGKSFSGMEEAKATLDKLAKLPTTNPTPRS
jgi:tetratricopeptide (TPR) repeat protein